MIPNNRDYGLLDVNGGTVYYGGIGSTSTTLTWMCRMLGYQSYGGTTNHRNYEWMQNYPVRYYQLECTGSIVPQCRYREANNYNYYPYSLWIICNARSQLGDSSTFHLVDKDNQHTQTGHGLLKYSSGTVSGNKFDDTTAELICRIMGYAKVMSWSTGQKYQFQESLSIRYKDLNCLASEDVFPLCVYGTDTTGETHDNDVWLWCALPKHSNYRLVCPPGQRRASSNTCIQCSANTYSPEPSETSSCLSCPSYSTSLAGSTYCSCNDDTYMSPDRDGCLQCPGNSTSVKESYSTNFTSLVGPTSCSCNNGTYMSSDGDECLECPGNSTSVKGSTQCACIAGTYLYSDLSSCVPCSVGTVSKEGGTAPTDCVPCPTGSVPINNGQVCSCEMGYGWEWGMDNESCKACPKNFYKDKDQGTCVRCPQEATSLPLSESCQCYGGLSWDGKICVDCTTPGNSTGVCNCSSGTFWNEQTNQCKPCPRNFFSSNFSTVCSKCPINTVSDTESSECSRCLFGSAWQNYTCSECPESHVGNGVVCSICPTGSLPQNNGQVCSCEKGYGWEWTSSGDGSCKACSANFFKDKELGTCIRCPHEATSLPLSEECHCPSGLSWDGESCVNCTTPGSSSGVCNCSAGTYWSGDSNQCEPCPTNHFSGQFSSVCSKCPIFTVSESQSSECSSCPKGYSWERHTCTECPENHVGNGATCSVCPEGTSPSKDKTICQKSAVDSLSVVSIVLFVVIFTMVVGLIIFTWRERRARIMMEDIQMVYQADPSNSQVKVHGRRCMCPSCPCSEVAKPSLPERGQTLQQDDVYANFS